ncbi:hypothetical protein GGX14DRAFT_586914 [Mycena pura]|uniref:Uncharacterized protein n=1 Tax=Mycena pura TaxID=153505 RepID=A0AAD6UWK5_9AGAR|nr:hypothetical protein GGX14DRAFT_586914 [Mycena pura]
MAAAPPNFLPIPVLPALVLQPVPVPNPALPQTDWNALSAAMQTVAAESANIPNSNVMQQIVAMNANMNTLVGGFNQLQNQLILGHNNLIGAFPGIVNTLNLILGGLNVVMERQAVKCFRLDLVPMRAHNAAAPASGHIQYPPNIVVAAPLPVTIGDAMMLTGPQYFAAINALIAANAPGLVAIANNVPFPQMQNHFLSYLDRSSKMLMNLFQRISTRLRHAHALPAAVYPAPLYEKLRGSRSQPVPKRHTADLMRPSCDLSCRWPVCASRPPKGRQRRPNCQSAAVGGQPNASPQNRARCPLLAVPRQDDSTACAWDVREFATSTACAADIDVLYSHLVPMNVVASDSTVSTPVSNFAPPTSHARARRPPPWTHSMEVNRTSGQASLIRLRRSFLLFETLSYELNYLKPLVHFIKPGLSSQARCIPSIDGCWEILGCWDACVEQHGAIWIIMDVKTTQRPRYFGAEQHNARAPHLWCRVACAEPHGGYTNEKTTKVAPDIQASKRALVYSSLDKHDQTRPRAGVKVPIWIVR